MAGFQAVRGMNDILPSESALWQWIEALLFRITKSYGYQEIRMPIVESTALFKRSIGDVTDIVEKEMYTFNDRNGDSLTLRPEGTASCVRALLEHGLLHNQQQKVWYQGPMFRHERPQKGRYRQFFQWGVEAIGDESFCLDAELILMTHRYWQAAGISQDLQLEINTLGSNESRRRYRDVLVDYFTQHYAKLDEDSQRRLTTNPLRILDSKNPDMRSIIEAAPPFSEYCDPESKAHFNALCELLTKASLPFVLNPRLVRGLDYYNRTVFEWTTTKLGAQGTVCAGGRYDGLVAELGGDALPAMGFSVGIDRILLLLSSEIVEEQRYKPTIYMIRVGEAAEAQGLILAENCRNAIPSLSILSLGAGSFKSQFKKADKSGASIALILGEQEVETSTVGIKWLREEREQENIQQAALPAMLQSLLTSGG